MSDKDNEDATSIRINVRIPRRQYDLMRRFGSVLGFETDSACAKHFVTMGLQASAGGISSIQVADNNLEAINELKRMNDNIDTVKQMDLVEEAARARA